MRPLETGTVGAVVRSAASLTIGAVMAAGVLAAVSTFVGVLVEEDLIDRAPGIVESVQNPAAFGFFALAAFGGLAEPLRLATERRLLLRAAEDAATLHPDREAPPPAGDRLEIALGPHGPQFAGGLAMAGFGALLACAGFVFASEESPVLPGTKAFLGIGAVLLVVGPALALPARPGGAARTRWEARRFPLEVRWRASVAPHPRATTRTRVAGGALALGAFVVGALLCVGCIVARGPHRKGTPDRWDETGERVIDVLFISGLVAALAFGGVLVGLTGIALVRTAIAQRSAFAALVRGAPADPGDVDGMLLDPSPARQAMQALAGVGWIALAFGAGWVVDDVASVSGGVVLLLGLFAVGAAWGLGALIARRERARAVPVHAMSGRDPIPDLGKDPVPLIGSSGTVTVGWKPPA